MSEVEPKQSNLDVLTVKWEKNVDFQKYHRNGRSRQPTSISIKSEVKKVDINSLSLNEIKNLLERNTKLLRLSAKLPDKGLKIKNFITLLESKIQEINDGSPNQSDNKDAHSHANQIDSSSAVTDDSISKVNDQSLSSETSEPSNSPDLESLDYLMNRLSIVDTKTPVPKRGSQVYKNLTDHSTKNISLQQSYALQNERSNDMIAMKLKHSLSMCRNEADEEDLDEESDFDSLGSSDEDFFDEQ
ncbi:hypothetical protein HDV02_004292 [Globomyces sp. JEL0801]|nr:hypothetical protein HDV02_004292 [Globomyces sp. JEL0801]